MANVVTAIGFNVPSNFSYSAAQVQFTSQGVQLLSPYATSNPNVLMLNALTLSAISSFAETSTHSGSDAIQYTLNINGADYYWNGSAWVSSNGTYAQSNTASVINTNLGASSLTALLGTGASVCIRAFLHSASGTTTPILQSLSITYTFAAIKPSNPTLCTVYVWLADILDDIIGSVQGATFSVTNNAGFKYGNFFVVPFVKSTTFDATGYAQLVVTETQTPGVPLNFAITYQIGKTTRQINFNQVIVPNQGAVALTSITTANNSGSTSSNGGSSGIYILSATSSQAGQVPVFTGTNGRNITPIFLTTANIAANAGILPTQLQAQTVKTWATFGTTGFLTPVALAASLVVVTDANGLPSVGATTVTELGFLHGVTSSIQTQFSAVAAILSTLLPASLNNGLFWMGNASNVPSQVAMSGDATMTNAGVITLSATAVIGKVLTGYFPDVRLANMITPADTILSAIEKLEGSSTLGRREAQVMTVPGGTTAVAVGITAPTLTATASAATNAIGPFINHATGIVSGNSSGVISAAFTIFAANWEPEFIAEIMTDAANTANMRNWIGFFSATPVASGTPSISLAAFRYDDSVDGTLFWRCCTDSGTGSPNVITTTVAFAANTFYRMRIILSQLNGAAYFYINDVLVGTSNTKLPAAATTLGWGATITTTTTAARNIKWSRFAFRSNG